jgi:hypothetical protein
MNKIKKISKNIFHCFLALVLIYVVSAVIHYALFYVAYSILGIGITATFYDFLKLAAFGLACIPVLVFFFKKHMHRWLGLT